MYILVVGFFHLSIVPQLQLTIILSVTNEKQTIASVAMYVIRLIYLESCQNQHTLSKAYFKNIFIAALEQTFIHCFH